MVESTGPFGHILVATDFSETAAAALESAAWAARRWQARLTVVHVVRNVMDSAAVIGYGVDWEPMMQDLVRLQQQLRHEADERLASLTAGYRTAGLEIDSELCVGRPFEEIVRVARRRNCDLVIVGDRGLSAVRRLLAGSTATKLVRSCPCPVWVARVEHAAGVQSILAATDFSETSEKALSVAASLASSTGAKLHLLHVYDTEDLHGLLPQSEEVKAELAHYRRRARRAALDRLRQSLSVSDPTAVDATFHVAQGTGWKVIAATARRLGVDLVVMGSVGRHSLPGLLVGNTAERVLHSSVSSVLVVKPDSFASPVQSAAGTEQRREAEREKVVLSGQRSK